MNRKIPLWLLILVLFFGLNALVIFGWSVRRVIVIPGLNETPVGSFLLAIASYPSMVKDALYEVGLLTYEIEDLQTEEELPPQLILNEFPNIDGFKKNGVVQPGALKDKGYIFLSWWDMDLGQSKIELIRIYDQQVVYKWIVDLGEYSSASGEQISGLWYRVLHPLLTNDGGLIVKGEIGSLIKIDVCSQMDWLVKGEFHHSTEIDRDGNIWTSGLAKNRAIEELSIHEEYLDETIVQISPDGKLLFERSIIGILEEHGLGGLVFGTKVFENDLLHTNDIQPALYSTEYWESGDILISLRHLSMVMLYRPSTNKIIWLKFGPWLNQHDTDFLGDSQITIFGNDNLRTRYSNQGPIVGGINNIYKFDFADDSISRLHTETTRRADIRTNAEGLHQILDNGDIFIEETLRGRLLRISENEVIWEFTKKINNNIISMLNWSRYLTENDVKDILPILNSANCD